jgi:hypothetical protein
MRGAPVGYVDEGPQAVMARRGTQFMNRKTLRLYAWLKSVEGNMLLETQVTSSGLSKALDELLLAGVVTLVAHPTVTAMGPAGRYPVTAVVLRSSKPV